jgi:hypothetical protein
VVAHAKSNLAPIGASQSYTLKGGRFGWAGRSSIKAEDLGAPQPDADLRNAVEEAAEFLIEMLANGPKPALEVQTEAARLRISSASLRRAKRNLSVASKREADQWMWNLPVGFSGPTGEESGKDTQVPEG